MNRIGVQLGLGSGLHHKAQIHDRDAVRDHLHHRQVVGDEHVRQLILLLKTVKQVEDLGLDGHVQGGDGLVGDDQLGVHGQGPGDADALLLAAGELVGIASRVLGAEAHDAQQLADHLGPLLGAHIGVDNQGLLDQLGDTHPGVQTARRILEDHLHVLAQGTHLVLADFGDLLALEPDLAAVRHQQVVDDPARGALAAAGLTHDGERLAFKHVKAYVVDRVDELRWLSQQGFAHGEGL